MLWDWTPAMSPDTRAQHHELNIDDAASGTRRHEKHEKSKCQQR
jgi:hypothetical protein